MKTLDERVSDLEEIVGDIPHLLNTRLELIQSNQQEANARLNFLDRQMGMILREIRDMRGGVTRQLMEQDKRIASMAQDISGLKSDVGDLKSDVSGLKSDVSGLKSDVTGLKSEFSGLKSNVSDLKSDFSDLKSDFSDLKSVVLGMKGDLQTILSRLPG